MWNYFLEFAGKQNEASKYLIAYFKVFKMFKDVLKMYIKLMTWAIIFFHSNRDSQSQQNWQLGPDYSVVGGYPVLCSIRIPGLKHEMSEASISKLWQTTRSPHIVKCPWGWGSQGRRNREEPSPLENHLLRWWGINTILWWKQSEL